VESQQDVVHLAFEEQQKESPGYEAPMNYAGFWVRFLAVILDSLILWSLSELLFNPLGLLIVLEYNFISMISILELVTGFLYYVILTAIWGQTLGKMALGIKVIRQDGTPLTWGTVVFREIVGKLLSAVIFLAGYIAVAIDPKKRGWHDHIAKTLVVKK
jgi:uncharacterized RDD family membrane protein YckC